MKISIGVVVVLMLVLVLLPGLSGGQELQLVLARQFANAVDIAEVRPIIAPDGEIAGLVYSLKSGDCVIYDRLSGEPPETLDISGDDVFAALGRQNGDTTDIYVLSDVLRSNAFWPMVTRLWFCNGDTGRDSALIHQEYVDMYTTVSTRRVWLDTASVGPGGIIGGAIFEYVTVEMTMGIRSHTDAKFKWLSWDLDSTCFSGWAARAYPRRGADGEVSDWVGYADYWWSVYDDPWNSGAGSGTRVWASSATSYGTPGGLSGGLLVNDFIPWLPGDEFVYHGNSVDFADPEAPARSFVGCYGWDGDSLVQVWEQSPAPCSPLAVCSQQRLIVGMNKLNASGLQWLCFLDYETGAIVDTINLNRNLAHINLFEFGDPRRLGMVGHLNDSILVYTVDTPTDVGDGDGAAVLPRSVVLHPAYPNPFNPSTVLSFENPRRQRVALKIYDVLGREVTTLVDREVSAGRHKVDWDASGYASGLYLARLQTIDESVVTKLLLIK